MISVNEYRKRNYDIYERFEFKSSSAKTMNKLFGVILHLFNYTKVCQVKKWLGIECNVV